MHTFLVCWSLVEIFGTSTIVFDSYAKKIEQKGKKPLQKFRHVIRKLRVFPDHMAQVYFCYDSSAMEKCIFNKCCPLVEP